MTNLENGGESPLGEEGELAATAGSPDPLLVEEGCGAAGGGGLDLLEATAVPPPAELSRAIYIELERAEASPDVEAWTLGKLLDGRGLLREQPSCTTEQDPSADASRFRTIYVSADTDISSLVRDLNDRPEVVHAIAAPRLVPPSTPIGSPLSEPLLLPRIKPIAGSGAALGDQWYIFRCRIDQAWAQSLSGKGVIIADIDWGYFTIHQEFVGRIDHSLNAIDGTQVVSRGSAICHGTAVLGIVGAANNGKGMAGVAFGADLWAIQAGNKSEGDLDPDPWRKAIKHVLERDGGGRRKIIMLEVSGVAGENIEAIPCIRHAIREAIAGGIVVCAAAGNGNRDAGLDAHHNEIPYCGAILVGATDFDALANPISASSNFGARVTVYAPGDEGRDLTCSSGAKNGYRNTFGRTSGATPKVVGTIALMLEANPQLTHFEIKDILRSTGSPIQTDDPRKAGVFLNAERAVLEARRCLRKI